MAPYIRLLPIFLTLLLPAVTLAELWGQYIRSPDSITCPLGDEVWFTCQTNNKVEKVVWWHRPLSNSSQTRWLEIDGKTSADSPYRITIKPSPPKVTTKSVSSRLAVKFDNESLAGEYRCVSWNGPSALASVSARLDFPWVGKLPKGKSQTLIVPHNSTVFIRCPPPKSLPPPIMIYYRIVNGIREEVDSVTVGDGLLITAKDRTSVYACAVRNSLTEVVGNYQDYHITVNVQNLPPERPKFTTSMVTEVTGKEGNVVDLICAAIGHPAPRIHWRRKDGSPLSSHSNISSLVLHISHLQAHDQGDYICTATNEAGKAEKTVHLDVWHAARLSKDKQSGDRSREEIVQEGGNIYLSCGHATGEPKPSFYWLINGYEVSNDTSIKERGMGIEINPVEKRHAGVIQCFATNILGSDYTGNVLKVLPKQHMTQPLEEGNKAHGRHGGRKGGNRKVLVPPSRPDVTRLSDESVMVRWTVQHNNGLPIVFFKVQYRDLNDTSGRRSGGHWNTPDYNIPSSVHSYEVGGLTAGHYYKFRIAAVYSNDDNKQGPNSAKFLLQHGADLPKAPPAPIFNRTEAVSTTAIRLYWELGVDMDMNTDTPSIEGFYIHYRPTSTAGEYLKEAVEGSHIRSHTLTSLIPGAQYEIKLQSFTRTVPSAFSTIIIQGTLKPPVVEKPNEMNTIINPGSGLGNGGIVDSNDNLLLYIIIGVVIVFAIVFIMFLIICCKKHRNVNKSSAITGSLQRVSDGNNGYHSTPTRQYTPVETNSRPHEVSDNLGAEMYKSAQNNNCSTTASTHGSIELLSPTCRDEIRKQSPTMQKATEN